MNRQLEPGFAGMMHVLESKSGTKRPDESRSKTCLIFYCNASYELLGLGRIQNNISIFTYFLTSVTPYHSILELFSSVYGLHIVPVFTIPAYEDSLVSQFRDCCQQALHI
jgi:hypothetical protein